MMAGLRTPRGERAQSVAHAHAPGQERRAAALVGGATTPGSGSGYQKGDARRRGLVRVECKATANRGFRVTRDDVAKLEAQALRLDLTKIDMRDLLRNVCFEANKRATDQGVRLHTFMPKTPVFCTCDRDRIYRVIQTLVQNAGRFSEPSQTVRVVLKIDETAMAVQVIDEAVPRDEDVRLEAVENVPRGGEIISNTSTGFALGLPISLRLVNAHGGRLSGHRTTKGLNVFSVLLPLEPAAEPETETAAT